MAYQYVDTLPGESKNRYEEKLRVARLDMCPYQLPEGIWIDNPRPWPSVEYPDIYDYLINTPGNDLTIILANRFVIFIN